MFSADALALGGSHPPEFLEAPGTILKAEPPEQGIQARWGDQ